MDELQYRAGFRSSVPQEPVAFSEDTSDFSTLKALKAALERYMIGLKTDFNMLTILEGVDPEIAAKDLVVQILAKQETFALLVSLLEMLNTTINGLDIQIPKN